MLWTMEGLQAPPHRAGRSSSRPWSRHAIRSTTMSSAGSVPHHRDDECCLARGLAQQVAGGHVGQVELDSQAGGLGALAYARWSEQRDAELARRDGPRVHQRRLRAAALANAGTPCSSAAKNGSSLSPVRNLR